MWENPFIKKVGWQTHVARALKYCDEQQSTVSLPVEDIQHNRRRFIVSNGRSVANSVVGKQKIIIWCQPTRNVFVHVCLRNDVLTKNKRSPPQLLELHPTNHKLRIRRRCAARCKFKVSFSHCDEDDFIIVLLVLLARRAGAACPRPISFKIKFL